MYYKPQAASHRAQSSSNTSKAMDGGDETTAALTQRQTLDILRALRRVRRPPPGPLRPGMPSPQQLAATLNRLSTEVITSRYVPLVDRWPLLQDYTCFAQIDCPNFFERTYRSGGQQWDQVRLRQKVCPVWAGYQPPAGMKPSHIITEEDHYAYLDALDEHTEDFKKIAHAINKPQGVVSIYLLWLYHFRGLQIEYGHILFWRLDLGCNEDEIKERRQDYHEQLAAGTWERDYAPVYLHQAFKNAGGGRIPTELLPLYASDPVEADVKAAATIAAALAENEERGATTGMLEKAFMSVFFKNRCRTSPWRATVSKSKDFSGLQTYSAHIIEAGLIADGGLRKKYGDDARTSLTLQLLPEYKDPRGDLPDGKIFYQGRSAAGGNQTLEEKKLIKMKIYSYEQLYIWKTTGRIPAYSHMKSGSEAVKWLLRQLVQVVNNAPTAPPAPAAAPLPLPPAPVHSPLAGPPHAQRRRQSPPPPQQQQQSPDPSSSSFINPFERQQPPRPSSLVGAFQPQQQQQQPQQPDPLGTSSLAWGGGPRPPPTPAVTSAASTASAAAAPAAAAATNDDDGDDEWVPFADLSIAAPAPTASNATGKTVGEGSEWMGM